jgi:hypothetical protein
MLSINNNPASLLSSLGRGNGTSAFPPGPSSCEY